MKFSTFLVDLDETVYSSSCGLWGAIRDRIDLYMAEKMGFDIEIIPDLRRSLFKEYGTTLRGLHSVYGMDPKEYLDFVHDLPLAKYLSLDPILRDNLLQLPQKKVIFTNADIAHARRVLTQVGISECFEDIIDIFTIHPYCKPQPEAFKIALKRAAVDDPSECAFLDDNVPNLATAQKMGLFSIRVGSQELSTEYHRGISSLKDLPELMKSFEGIE